MIIIKAKFKKFCDKKLEDYSHHTEIPLKKCTTPITIFLGPNGTGKSQSLLNIRRECDALGIKCISYSNKRNDIISRFGLDAGIEALISGFHSEGERIEDSITFWFSKNVAKLKSEDNIVILLDELDSGLSIDKLKYILNQFIILLVTNKRTYPNKDIRIIFTCNSWEMLSIIKELTSELPSIYDLNLSYIFKPTTYWVPTKESVDFENYEEFKKLYLEYYDYMYSNLLKDEE